MTSKIYRKALICFLSCAISVSAWATLPNELEPDYFDAVLSYNARDYSKTMEQLNALLKNNPDVTELWELKALVSRVTQNDIEAMKTYAKLIEAKRKQGAPEADLAAYHFELGLLFYKMKKPDQAIRYFEFSEKYSFNGGASNLYIGILSFQKGLWEKSEKAFEKVLSSSAEDLKPVGYFYLGQTYIKSGYATGATQNFIAAKDAAQAIIDDPNATDESKKISTQILDATTKALSPFSKGQFFASLSLSTGYDSNVLAIPSVVDASSITTGTTSFSETGSLSFGYATSSLKRIQFVPSFRGSYPYLFNRKLKSSEYPGSTASLYINHKPLSRFSFGLKGDVTVTFKNDVNTVTNQGIYRLYTTAYSFGPYARYEIKKRVVLSLETFLQPISYNQDAASGSTSRRSGSGYLARLSAQNDRGTRFFNPGVSLKREVAEADGKDYRTTTHKFEMNNDFHLNSRLNANIAAGLAQTKYPDRTSGIREDKTYTVDLTSVYKWKPKWSFLGNFNLIKNSSNLESAYSYNRFLAGAGISYQF